MAPGALYMTTYYVQNLLPGGRINIIHLLVILITIKKVSVELDDEPGSSLFNFELCHNNSNCTLLIAVMKISFVPRGRLELNISKLFRETTYIRVI